MQYSMSFIEANHLEKKYDKNRLHGHVYCAFEMINLFNASLSKMIKVFKSYHQVLS